MSRSQTQSKAQHICRACPTASSADFFGRYPYDAGRLFTFNQASQTSHREIQNGFASSFRLLPSRVDLTDVASLHTPPSLHRLSPTSSLLRSVPSLGAAFVLSPSWFMPLVTSPLTSAPKVPMFRIIASPEIKPPICRIPSRP